MLLCEGARTTGTSPAVVVSFRKNTSYLEFYIPRHKLKAQSEKLSYYFKEIFGKTFPIKKLTPKTPLKGRAFSPLPGIKIIPCQTPFSKRFPDKTIILDSSQAFGTGRHPTTQLALAAIQKHAKHVHSLIDIGTGTGILAIAAARIFRIPVVWGIESARETYRIAKHHAEVNRSDKHIRLVNADIDRLRKLPRFDLVVANLTLEIILKNLVSLVRTVKPEGLIFFTGILKAESAVFMKALRKAPLTLRARSCKKDWEGFLYSNIFL